MDAASADIILPTGRPAAEPVAFQHYNWSRRSAIGNLSITAHSQPALSLCHVGTACILLQCLIWRVWQHVSQHAAELHDKSHTSWYIRWMPCMPVNFFLSSFLFAETIEWQKKAIRQVAKSPSCIQPTETSSRCTFQYKHHSAHDLKTILLIFPATSLAAATL